MTHRVNSLAIAFSLFAQVLLAETPELSVKTMLTHGYLGPARTSKILACDMLHGTQSISGLKHDSTGRVDFSIRTEIIDHEGKVVDLDPWQRVTDVYPPSIMHLAWKTGLSTDFSGDKAGLYVWKTTVKDHLANVERTAEVALELLPPKGIVAFSLRCGHDPVGKQNAGAVFSVGEQCFVHGWIGNFKLDNAKMNCRFNVRIVDLNGKSAGFREQGATGTREITGQPMQQVSFNFYALKAGKFMIHLDAEDLNGGTKTTETIPFQVLSPDWALGEDLQSAKNKGELIERR